MLISEENKRKYKNLNPIISTFRDDDKNTQTKENLLTHGKLV
jgi:hypothetical protein